MSLHQQQQASISSASSSLPPTRSAKTQSLPRSESGLSGSGGSGYAPTGSENSIDNGGVAKKSSSQAQELPPTTGGSVAAASLPGTTKNKASSGVKVVTAATGNSDNGATVPITQAQVEVFNHQPNQVNSQLSYPLQKLLAQPLSFDIENNDMDGLLDPQHGVNFHQHGNVYNHPHSHSHSNQLYHQHTTTNRGGTVPTDFQQSRRGLHRNQVPHHSINLDHIRLPNHAINHVSFNPGGRPVRTSPGLPSISAAVPPPPHFGGITVDIDV